MRSNTCYDLGKEWICDFRDDKTENSAASGNKGTSLCVGIVAKFFNDVPDSLGKLRIDRRNPIDSARHRRSRNTCSLGDFANIHEMSRGVAGREPETPDDIKEGNRLPFDSTTRSSRDSDREDLGVGKRKSTIEMLTTTKLVAIRMANVYYPEGFAFIESEWP